MQCPRCRSTQFSLDTHCPACDFTGDVLTLEQLSNLRFLLTEVESWTKIPTALKMWVRERYRYQQRQTEIKLGLRQPVPTIAEARLLHLQLAELKTLKNSLGTSQFRGWISQEIEARLNRETSVAITAIREHLIDAPPIASLSREKQLLQKIEAQRFIITTFNQLMADGEITAVSHLAATAHINSIIAEYEIQAGLRQAPQPKQQLKPTSTRAKPAPKAKAPTATAKAEAEAVLAATLESTPTKPKRPPWNWDRVWDSLLSERTLQAILFLGAMLLFAAGVSWVAWNWGTFSAVVQITFLSGFTALFYALGGYVNKKMNLPGSGNALIGVGSLLVPLDFYAFYISGGFPAESWPTVWLVGSLICLAAYLSTVYLIKADFFGYLVAVAAGSSVVALLNLLHVPTAWWQVGIAATALGLAVCSEWLHAQPATNRWCVMKRPFAHTSLAAALATMAVGIAWAFFGGRVGRPFMLALAISWWLGAATLTIMTRRYRLQMVVWSAVIAFPVAVWLTERWLFLLTQTSQAWYAVGWALLVPIYLVVGWQVTLTQRREGAKEERKEKEERNLFNLRLFQNLRNLRFTPSAEDAALGRIVLQAAGMLTAVSALWSLTDTVAAGIVHPLLALSMVLAARLWQKPIILWLTTLFLLSGSAAWQGGRGATLPELTLPWALLAILFVATAVRLKSTTTRYDEPLYGAGLVTAGLAILPPLLLSDQPLLTYALGNWIGINGWLAYLAHGKQAPGLQSLLVRRHLRQFGAAHFHWGAALALLPWLWLFWTNNTQPSAALALTYAVMAWVMLWLHLRLRKLRWQYGLPWQIAAHLSNVAAVGFALFYHQEPWRAGVFWGTAVFYFVAAKLMHQRTWLIVGAWLLPIGWLFTLEWLNLPATYYPPALAIVVLGYAIATFWLLQRGTAPSFLKPLTLSAIVIAALQAIFFTVLAVTASDIDLIGIAGGFLILGVSLLLFAWIENGEAHAHAGIWLSIVAGGVVVEVYSRDSGQSAAIAAVAAIVLMLAERGLHYLVRTQRGQFAPVLRQGWLLYKRPLLITGWTVSAAALGLALFYAQEPWRAGVFVGTAVFYFVAAYLFRQRNWLIVGAWLLPIGWLFTLEWVNLPATYYPPALAIVVLGYAITTFWLLHRGVRPPFLKPLTVSSLAIGGLQTTLFIVFIVRALLFSNAADADLVGIAGGYLILGISGLLYAWTENSPALAHVGIWLNIVAGGLAVKVYSRGSGLSAAIAALAAIALVLAERGLHYLAITHRGQFATILRRGWRLHKRPLLAAGWIISVAAIGAALVRNLVWLGGGTMRETWSLVALTLVVALYAGSAKLFRKSDFVLYASLTSFLPWTLATYLFFKPALGIYGFSWSLLALILLGISILLAVRLGYGRWNFGAQAVAHGLMVVALLWAFTIVPTVSLTFGVGVMFYETAVWIDRRFREKGSPASSRFLYPVAFFMPIWAVYTLLDFVPSVSARWIGLLLLSFSLPALWLGRRWARWEPGYRWPLYILAYGSAIAAMILVFDDLPTLIGVVTFNAGLAILSVWVFRDAHWWYAATGLLPAAASLMLFQLNWDDIHNFGWSYIALGGIYLFGAWLLTKRQLAQYAQPLLIMSFLVTGAGLLPSLYDAWGILIGFGMATAVYTTMSIWKRQPILLFISAGLATIAYGAAMSLIDIDYDFIGLAMWPGILLVLLTAVYLDYIWGIEPDKLGNKLDPFPWSSLSGWPNSIYQRVRRWWALSLYLTAFAAVALSGITSIFGDWQWVASMGLGTAVYTWALFRFRLRGWLLLALFWAQLFAASLINWIGWTDSPAQVAFAFLPVTLATAAMGLLVEKVRAEGAPFIPGEGWRLGGWSRPFYLLLCANIFIGQLFGFMGELWMGTAVTFVHAIILAVFTTVWMLSGGGYVALFLGVVGSLQLLNGFSAPATAYPPALAAVALIYGTLGYSWRILTRMKLIPPPWLTLWERPLRVSAWIISIISLLLMLGRGLNVFGVALRVIVGLDVIRPSELPQATMMILTFAILGLLYLLAALADQRPRIGYGALLLLLGSWSLWLLLIANQDELQLYAIPASIYLLGIGWMEWQTDHRQLARWIDRAALLLMFGSIFWQSFGDYGGWYAMLMIVEGLLVAWLGSWRRLRRLLYVGVTAVVVAVAGQLIEPLLALNTFVLLLLGGLLVALGIGLERRLDKVRDLSKELRSHLEHWE